MIAIIKEALGRIFYILPSIPEQVQIEVTNKCNLDCNMCPRHDFGLEYDHIDFDMFNNILKRLNEVPLITLTGWGEPFMHPRIFDMIKRCKEQGFQVQLTTNGIFPSDSTVTNIIDSELDSISFSIDSLSKESPFGHNNNVAQNNIVSLIKARKKDNPKIAIQTTIQKNRENDIFYLIKWGASVGADRVNLGRLDQRFNKELPRPSREEEKRIMAAADKLGRECEIGVDCIQYAVGKGIQKGVYKVLKSSLHRFGKFCLKTYSYVYININGDVTPCCSLPRHNIDNILESSLKEIWQSKKFIEFRKKQSEVCGNCDMWSIKYLSK